MPGLISEYVDLVLNGNEVAAIPRLFDVSFRDGDPMIIPGITERDGRLSDLDCLERLVLFLSSPTVDIEFEIMDSFESCDGKRVACRVRGEGTIQANVVGKSTLEASLDLDQSKDSRTGSGGPRIPIERDILSRPGKLLGRRLHVEYYATSIFAIANRRFTHRWGLEMIR